MFEFSSKLFNFAKKLKQIFFLNFRKFKGYHPSIFYNSGLQLTPATPYAFELYGVFSAGPPRLITDIRRIEAQTPQDSPDIFFGNVTKSSMEVSFTPIPNVQNWYVNIVPLVAGIDQYFNNQPNLAPAALIPGQEWSLKWYVGQTFLKISIFAKKLDFWPKFWDMVKI